MSRGEGTLLRCAACVGTITTQLINEAPLLLDERIRIPIIEWIIVKADKLLNTRLPV